MANLPRLPQLGPRTRKVLYYVGMVVLAFVTFVFAVQATFPYDRVKAKIEEAAAAKVDMQIGKIKRGILPGVFYLEDVSIKTRPSKEDLEKAYSIADAKERDKAVQQLSSTIFIENLEVDIGLLGLISSTASIDFRAKFGEGNIHGNASISNDGTTVSIVGDDVPSDLLPMREVLSNLPMSGDIDFDFDLDLPNEKLKSGKTGPNWQKAEADLEFSCPAGCIIGDGKAKLKLKAKNQRSQAFAGEGTDFGRVKLQSLVAKVEVKDGKLDITKFDAQSSDVELHVDLTMTLAQELNESVVLGCLRFKPTEALRKREPKTYDQILLTGAARHTDGLDHIRLKGTFKDLKKLPEVCGPGVSGTNIDVPSGPPARPNLTVQPDEPARPPGAQTPPVQFVPPDAGVAHDAAVAVPIPGPGSEHAVGSGSGSGSAVGSAMGSAGSGGSAEGSGSSTGGR